MGQSAAQAAAWRREVSESGRVWTIEDDDGIPAPRDADGKRSMPFWSKRSRAERVIATVDAYASFRVRELLIDEFASRWLDGLERDGLLVGINWSGLRATGYDVHPRDVRSWLAAM